MLSTLGKISQKVHDILKYFLSFFFSENMLWYFVQINVKAYFLGCVGGDINLSSAEYAQRMLKWANL